MTRYIMVGGFLGAGKTTAMLRFGQHLADKGLRVGLITNDQSSGLVDTTMLSASGFPVEEITGGCFCCRFTSLTDAAERLTARTTPDVFLAEPVGSCTDLKATVSYPLRRMYGDSYSVAPFSVLVDPARALRVLGVETGRRFTDKVQYVYLKQLEEADALIINKVDAIEPSRVAALRTALASRFPRAAIFEVSARTGAGLEAWFDHVDRCGRSRHRQPGDRLRRVRGRRSAAGLAELHGARFGACVRRRSLAVGPGDRAFKPGCGRGISRSPTSRPRCRPTTRARFSAS